MTADASTAPDGSPIEVYRRLPPTGEPELIHGALPDGCEILELGCGAGRVTHPLVALGHPVTAVDESPAMLAHVRGARTVPARIETLDLEQRFRGVVLGSHFINTADDEVRRALLQACRRHLANPGSVLIQAYDPDFDWLAAIGRRTQVGSVAITLLEAKRSGSLVRAKIEYAVDRRVWIQDFTAELLGEDELRGVLSLADLQFVRWLDQAKGWLEAGAWSVPSPAPSSILPGDDPRLRQPPPG